MKQQLPVWVSALNVGDLDSVAAAEGCCCLVDEKGARIGRGGRPSLQVNCSFEDTKQQGKLWP